MSHIDPLTTLALFSLGRQVWRSGHSRLPHEDKRSAEADARCTQRLSALECPL